MIIKKLMLEERRVRIYSNLGESWFGIITDCNESGTLIQIRTPNNNELIIPASSIYKIEISME